MGDLYFELKYQAEATWRWLRSEQPDESQGMELMFREKTRSGD